jgi:hypothetical protein
MPSMAPKLVALAAAALLVVGAASASSSGPTLTVKRFLVWTSPKTACAQLSTRYRKQLDAKYGPCVQAIQQNPSATRVRFSNVKITGAKASLHVSYIVRGRTVKEVFALAKQGGRWLIDNARPA